MAIYYHEESKTFHLKNDFISYVLCILPNGQPGQLYFGPAIHDRPSFDYLLKSAFILFPPGSRDGDCGLSMEKVRLEYPVFGAGDYREGALEVLQENGSRLVRLEYESHEIQPGKPKLPGLPATYTERPEEAETLVLHLSDRLLKLSVDLCYTIFTGCGVIARSVRIRNEGGQRLTVTRAMSACLDLPDSGYEWMQFSGAWARERRPFRRNLAPGTVAVESARGNSSAQENPFVILKRPDTTEFTGEAIGFSLVYSGNFRISAEVDAGAKTRVLTGISPAWFSWVLEPGEAFQTPEAVTVFSAQGLNGLSQTLHTLYRTRLARGAWRDEPRPILINNWEATYFDFNEEKLLNIARKAKECGVELFVLDDGWFGARRNDTAGLGDWVACRDLLPGGIQGLSEKVEALGLKFGLWIEPEMVNPDSDLYRAHPDWCLTTPGRPATLSRTQMVLDYSRPEVVDAIHEMLYAILSTSRISYIKWDMNRSITECYSAAMPPEKQGEVYHRYILGVYSLYERLTSEFPHILFESCASGGARFDPGMLYYAPQAWTSDNTDAVERIKIQYGTSYAYPISSMGSHVSAVPNHQMGRLTPLKTRVAVALFGTYGYEMDLNTLTDAELEQVKAYTALMKQYRRLIQFGTFYRLMSPFAGEDAAWMVVSEDRKEALVAFFRPFARMQDEFSRVYLSGLDPAMKYRANGKADFYGDELMNAGLLMTPEVGDLLSDEPARPADYEARLVHLLSE